MINFLKQSLNLVLKIKSFLTTLHYKNTYVVNSRAEAGSGG